MGRSYIEGAENGSLFLNEGEFDKDIALLEQEREKINDAHSDDQNLKGLALSGGGIRAAIFSIGIMEVLAKKGVLDKMDYLSTVSGGGFAGSSLMWWLAGNGEGNKGKYNLGDKFPYQDDPNAIDIGLSPLQYLRQNGNYLTPGRGIDAISILGIVLRGIFINFLVWIPIITAILYLMGCGIFPDREFELIGVCGFEIPFDNLILLGIIGVFILHPLLAIWMYYVNRQSLGSSLLRKRKRGKTKEILGCIDSCRRKLNLLLIILTGIILLSYCYDTARINAFLISKVIAVLFIATYFLSAIIFALFAWVGGQREWIDRLQALSVSLLRIFSLKPLRLSQEYSTSYFFRRYFETDISKLIPAVLALLLIGYIPEIYKFLLGQTKAFSGLADHDGLQWIGSSLSALIGILTAVWGLFLRVKNTSISTGVIAKIVAPLGAAFFVLGLVLFAYALSEYYLDKSKWEWAGEWADFIFWGIFAFAVYVGLFSDINYLSPHRFYRDRLMEAFLPNKSVLDDPKIGFATRADSFELNNIYMDCISGRQRDRKERMKCPYPIISTNVVLVDSDIQKYQTRGGDNFMLTPFYCGSNATGWSKTKEFADQHLTLATAMSISGAAVNPNTGAAGRGVTRNRTISLVMAFFNFGLGQWVQRPGTDRKSIFSRGPFAKANHFRPGFLSLFPHYHKEDKEFLELSDGGHFENLALYELIRRGCKTIIVVDGGQDRDTAYEDLVNFIGRVEDDFGAIISLDDWQKKGFDPSHIIPREVGTSKNPIFPEGAEFAKRGFFVADINYTRHQQRKSPVKGLLIYIKSTLIETVDIQAKAYKGLHPDFPDESTTGDQFFDAEQFEAYRKLGKAIAEDMIKHIDISKI